MEDATGSDARLGEGDPPDKAETVGAPGPFTAATKPIPADWYLRDQSPAPTLRPAFAPETPAEPAERRRANGRGPRRRRLRTPIVWGLAGVLVLGGAGIGATLFLRDDGKNDRADTAVGAEPAPTPTASTAPAAGKPPANDVDSPKNPKALTPAAYAAWKRIDQAMAAEGIKLKLNSGKRGWRHQQKLLDDKIAEVGSREAALHWVLPPEKSMHVQGVAVDIYPADAQAWLQAKGSEYGWCRLYDNEVWHFEYNASYTRGCPPRLPSALDS
ncbi:D-alanyl-D-alanine carboxypeptidase family protein [Embleya hyalina]|uniref:Putative VanY-type carboxypeptidase n=1 Tax=Embleya hyalina TaxID=516124 RepID=A0A401Z604_9ACTN|nr:D-alanyl-D-alanine carboxypeptidase family protein [Embleya hyalina]GCE02275.1 putative VanY-type carboxypeptidase [Embleya hyalina]